MPSLIYPVEQGLVTSLARPGGNITGPGWEARELAGKRLNLLKEATPKLARVAVLWNPTNLGAPSQWRETQSAARKLRVTLQSLEVRDPNDVPKVFSAMTQKRPDALITFTSPLTTAYRPLIIEFAIRQRLPTMFAQKADVEAGGLMSYAPSITNAFRQAAQYVDKVLKGVNPGDQGTGYGLMNYALIGAKFTFTGKTAHASVNPWDGKDAVDAVVLMDIGFDKLREHLRPTYRAHRAITMGGTQPNIIPDKGQIWWFVRDATGPAANETYDKLVNIAKGAALMIDPAVEIQPFGAAWPQLGNKMIGEAIQRNIEAVGMPRWSEEEEVRFSKELQKSVGAKDVGLHTQVRPFRAGAQTTASNDIGDITWNVPTGVLNFPSSVPGVLYHHWKAAITPTMSIASIPLAA